MLSLYVKGSYVANVYNKIAIIRSGVRKPQQILQYKPGFRPVMNIVSWHIRFTPNITGTSDEGDCVC